MATAIKEFETATSLCEACGFGDHERILGADALCGCACHTEVPAHKSVIGCNKCHRDFPGPTGASEFINHLCHEASQERKRKAEDVAEAKFAEAFGELVDQVGLFCAVEAMGRCCENWNDDRRWDEVSRMFFGLSEEISREGYHLER